MAAIGFHAMDAPRPGRANSCELSGDSAWPGPFSSLVGVIVTKVCFTSFCVVALHFPCV